MEKFFKPLYEKKWMERASFLGSFVRLDACPKPDRHEFAFIGRSNVGKSSLINMLTGQKQMAKVSGTPGKTQTINYYDIDGIWYIVDLPGYGYARVSKTLREQWEKMISFFLRNRTSITCLFVLLDSNVPPQKADLDFMKKLTEWKVPFAIILTKTDRLNQSERTKSLRSYEKAVEEQWSVPPNVFLSSIKGLGRNEILGFIMELQKPVDE